MEDPNDERLSHRTAESLGVLSSAARDVISGGGLNILDPPGMCYERLPRAAPLLIGELPWFELRLHSDNVWF